VTRGVCATLRYAMLAPLMLGAVQAGCVEARPVPARPAVASARPQPAVAGGESDTKTATTAGDQRHAFRSVGRTGDALLRDDHTDFSDVDDLVLEIKPDTGPIRFGLIVSRVASVAPRLESLSFYGDLRAMPPAPPKMPASLQRVKFSDADATQACVEWAARLPDDVEVSFVAIDLRFLDLSPLYLRRVGIEGCILSASQVDELVTGDYPVRFNACQVNGWHAGLLRPLRADR
jgi:hypothetical protein